MLEIYLVHTSISLLSVSLNECTRIYRITQLKGVWVFLQSTLSLLLISMLKSPRQPEKCVCVCMCVLWNIPKKKSNLFLYMWQWILRCLDLQKVSIWVCLYPFFFSRSENSILLKNRYIIHCAGKRALS